MLIADVLRGKIAGSTLATTAPSATVGELLGLLAQYNVGALPVVDGGQLVGIVSERDVVRQLHERGRDLLDARVGDIMSADVVTCSPRDRAADLARVMTDRRIRHLPVCDESRPGRHRQHRRPGEDPHRPARARARAARVVHHRLIRQKPASASSISVSSVCSMITRSAVSSGRRVAAKNRAAAILPS